MVNDFDDDEDISALWVAAMRRKDEEEDSQEEVVEAPKKERVLRTAQEMSMICLNGRAKRSKGKCPEGGKYDFEWNDDGILVFAQRLERGSRIDCWLGSLKRGSITSLHYLSHLVDGTEAGEPIICLGSWEWSREMSSGLGGYNIVRNFWGEDEGIPDIKESINGMSDKERFDNAWAKLMLSEPGDGE